MLGNLIQKAYASGVSAEYTDLLQRILTNIVNPFVSLLIGAAVIYFLWGVLEYIMNAESSDKRKEGQMRMLYGVLGIFIMVTAYGILNLIINTVRQ